MRSLKVTEKELSCFVFEKESPGEKNGEISDGIHLMFPNIVVFDKLRHVIFKQVYDECNEEELFNKYCNPTTVLDSMIVSTNPWLMYGCCKPSNIPYKLTQILDNKNNNTEIEFESTKL